MVKRSTWIWLILFVAVVGLFLTIHYRNPVSTATATPTTSLASYLFTDADGNPVSIRIYDNQYHIMMMERTSGGLWTLVLPTPGPADQSGAEAGATQISALRIVEILNTTPPLSSTGLNIPSYVIKVGFENGTKHILEVGNKTPSGSGYYVRVDNDKVYILSADGIDSLVNLLTTPPVYVPATPTPTPLPLQNPTPLPGTATP